MRITKRRLRRIIKEQMGSHEPLKTAAEWVEHLGQLIDQDMTERNVDLRDEGSELVEALEMLRREYKDEMRGPTR